MPRPGRPPSSEARPERRAGTSPARSPPRRSGRGASPPASRRAGDTWPRTACRSHPWTLDDIPAGSRHRFCQTRPVAVLGVVQHVAFEGPGLISVEAHARGMLLAVTRRDRGDSLPPVDEIDGLIVMGGPMSAHDVRDEWPLMAAAVRPGLP